MSNSFSPNVGVMTGDSGSGGAAGLAPAPSAGDASSGKFLKADATWSVPPSSSGGAVMNLAVNSAFDFWQAAGTSISMASGASNYLADQFYAINGMGVSSLLVYSQTGASVAGSAFGAQLKVTAAPNVAGNSGINIAYIFDNAQTARVYNQTVSAGIQVKSLGNITGVGLQWIYAQTEVKPTISTTIGSATVTGVTTGGFVNCPLNGVALGTSMTTAGVIALKVFGVSVSSGNISDLNNGFIVEQLMVNTGSSVGSWARSYPTVTGELLACQRFYWKTFQLTTVPAQSAGLTGSACYGIVVAGSNGQSAHVIWYPTVMRITPTVTTYNPSAGNNKPRNTSTSADWASIAVNSSYNNTLQLTGSPDAGSGSGQGSFVHITADARI